MPSIPLPREIPFSVQEMREEFDRMLDRVWHGGLSTAPLDGQDWAPRLDVYEHPDHYQVRVEIPGLTADDVQVSIGHFDLRKSRSSRQREHDAQRRLTNRRGRSQDAVRHDPDHQRRRSRYWRRCHLAGFIDHYTRYRALYSRCRKYIIKIQEIAIWVLKFNFDFG